MDEVTIIKKRFRKEQWKQWITECQSSGMNVDDWCSQHNVSRNSYYYWLRRIREEICENLPASVSAPENPAAFKRLEIQPPVLNNQAAVIIRLPQATLEITEGTSQQTIQAVLLALQNLC